MTICAACVHRRGDNQFVRCGHPSAHSMLPGEISAIVKKIANGGANIGGPLDIKADPTGVRAGAFNWPHSYDPIWLRQCTGVQSEPGSTPPEKLVSREDLDKADLENSNLRRCLAWCGQRMSAEDVTTLAHMIRNPLERGGVTENLDEQTEHKLMRLIHDLAAHMRLATDGPMYIGWHTKADRLCEMAAKFAATTPSGIRGRARPS